MRHMGMFAVYFWIAQGHKIIKPNLKLCFSVCWWHDRNKWRHDCLRL